MKKILFPTNFSEHSIEVLKFALAFSYWQNAKLIVFHAFGKPNILDMTKEEIKEQISRMEDRMSSFINQNIESFHENIQMEYSSQINYPAEGILDIAQKESVDLIVMGITNTVDGNFLGHKALQILEKTNCLLLAIPKNVKFEGIRNIVLTADFEKLNVLMIKRVKNLIRQARVDLYCVHVVENIEKQVVVWQIINDLEGVFRGQRTYFDTIKGSLQVEVKDYAIRRKADIVVMIAREQGFFARLLRNDETKRIARNLGKPFLVIKE